MERSLCSRTERWLSERGRTRIPTELRQHVLACKECQHEYSAALPLRQLLGNPCRDDVAAYSATRDVMRASILQQISQETVPVRRAERRFLIRGAAAALVVVGIGIAVLAQLNSQPLATNPQVSQSSSPQRILADSENGDPTVNSVSAGRGIDQGDGPNAEAQDDRIGNSGERARPPFLVGIETTPPRLEYIPVTEVNRDMQGEVLQF